MTDRPTIEQQPDEQSSGMDIRRIAMIAAGALIGVILLLFIIAVILSLVTDVEQTGNIIRMIRDLVIIFLALEGVLIILGLAVLTIQVARLVNLLQTEVKPILENTQETVRTAQGTVEFVGNNLAEPVIKANGFIAGATYLVTNLFGICRALKRAEEGRDYEA